MKSWQKISLVILLLVLIIAKRPDSLTTPQLYIEDETVFFKQNYEQGFHAFVIPYTGYYCAIPRIIAAVASLFPLEHVPFVNNLAVISLTWGLLLWILLVSNLPQRIRIGLAFAPLVVPNPWEVYHIAASFQSWLPYGMCVLLIQEPSNGIKKAVENVLLFIAGLTGP